MSGESSLKERRSYAQVAASKYVKIYGPSILDWLNEDCWRRILDLVPARDILGSERVSRQWRAVVHRYLQDVSICVRFSEDKFELPQVKLRPKNRILHVSFPLKPSAHMYQNMARSMDRFLSKFGNYMVHSSCPGKRTFKKITELCPNLKSLTIGMTGYGTGDLAKDEAKFVERLERIAFLDYTDDDSPDDCFDMCDKDTRRMVHAFTYTDINSAFWSNLKLTNLKSLTIRGWFDLKHFLSTAQFPKLTELNLLGDLKNVHAIFPRTPKLERLCLMGLDYGYGVPKHHTLPNQNILVEEICDILRGLHLEEFTAWRCHAECVEWWFETVLSCPELRSVILADISGGENGVKPETLYRRQRPALTEIRLLSGHYHGCIHCTDDEVASIVRSCPKLTTLDLRCSERQCVREMLTLAPAAAAVRGRSAPVRLRVSAKVLKSNQVGCPGLIVDTTPIGKHFIPEQNVGYY